MLAIITSILMLSFQPSAVNAQSEFDRIFCVEKGYTAKTMEIRMIGDRLLFQFEEANLVADHPNVSGNFLDFDLSASQCEQFATDTLSCTGVDGLLRTGVSRASLKKVTYQNLTLSLEPMMDFPGEKGTKITLQVSGKDVGKNFVKLLYFTTKLDGDPAFASFCKFDGKIIND